MHAADSYYFVQQFHINRVKTCMHNSGIIRKSYLYCLIMLGTYSTIDDNQLDEPTRQACD